MSPQSQMLLAAKLRWRHKFSLSLLPPNPSETQTRNCFINDSDWKFIAWNFECFAHHKLQTFFYYCFIKFKMNTVTDMLFLYSNAYSSSRQIQLNCIHLDRKNLFNRMKDNNKQNHLNIGRNLCKHSAFSNQHSTRLWFYNWKSVWCLSWMCDS